MADIKPRNYITGIILFMFFIVAGVSLVGIFRDVDPNFANDQRFNDFNKTFSKLDDLNAGIAGIGGSITDTDPEPGVFGVINSLISSAWNALRTLFSSFGFMNDIFAGLSTIFGIPLWITGILSLLVTVMIAFSIYVLIFGRE